MQWILQDFEDTRKLAEVLARLNISYSTHKVVPFVGALQPDPIIPNPNSVVLFGSYTLWRYAEKNELFPGVIRIRPFVHETPWQPFMLNGADALFLPLRDIPKTLPPGERAFFIRPVSDSKEQAGRVQTADDIRATANKVLSLQEHEIPNGSLRHDTEMMLTPPRRILKEWRIWVVNEEVVTASLYKAGTRVVYRDEIDDDARAFAKELVAANPNYACAYVMDICRTPDGLRLLETNCINAAGFYAANLAALVMAIDGLT